MSRSFRPRPRHAYATLTPPLRHLPNPRPPSADIKAENFLYKTRESDVDDFQLIDFGISKVRARLAGFPRLPRASLQ